MSRRSIGALGIVLTFVAALLSPGPATAQRAAAPDWAALPYFGYDDTGSYFNIHTNAELWDAYRVINVQTGLSPAYPTPETYSGKVIEAIWKPTCPKTKGQKIQFSRDVQLSGLPGSLLLNVMRSVGDHQTMHQGKVAISAVEIRLNGTRLARLTGKKEGVNTWRSIDVSGHRDLIEYGTNRFTVLATKTKTTKSQGFCSSKSPDFGVAFELVGRPVVDLYSAIPTAYPASPSFTVLVATISNSGPSHSGDAAFTFQTLQESAGADVVSLTMETEDGTCQTFSQYDGYVGNCFLDEEIAPHALHEVTITVEHTLPCPSSAFIKFSYHVSNRWQDTDRTNDGRSDRQITCG